MIKKATAATINVYVHDTSANAGKTGLTSAGTSLYVLKDGTSAAVSVTTATWSEWSSANMPGVYKLTLTSADTNADVLTVAGKTTATSAIIYPVTLLTVSTVDANVIQLDSSATSAATTLFKTNVVQFASTAVSAANLDVNVVKLDSAATSAASTLFRSNVTQINSSATSAAGNILNANIVQANGSSANVTSILTAAEETTAIYAKLPASGLIASNEDIAGITNSTRFVGSLPTSIQYPVAGDDSYGVYRIRALYYDETGTTLEDPHTSAIGIRIFEITSAGESSAFTSGQMFTTNALTTALTSSTYTGFLAMVRETSGIFNCYLKVTSAFDTAQYDVEFKLADVDSSATPVIYARSIDFTEAGDDGACPLVALDPDNSNNITVIRNAMTSGDFAGSLETSSIADKIAKQAATETLNSSISEPSSVPSAASFSFKDAVASLFMNWRNKKTTTRTTQTIYKNDGSTAYKTISISDDGTTFTKNSYGS